MWLLLSLENNMPIPHNPAITARYREPILPYAPACILTGLLVYPTAIVLAIPLLLMACAIYSMAYPTGQFIQDRSLAEALRVFVVSTGFVCSGFTIGLFQKHLVKRYFRVNLSRWSFVSMIGACLAGWFILFASDHRAYLLATLAGALGDHFNVYDSFMRSIIKTPMIQFTLILSALQTVYLYRYLRSAWIWIPANVAAGALFFWLFVYAFANESFVSWLVAAITQALLVGWAMEFLMTRRRRGGKVKRDAIPVS